MKFSQAFPEGYLLAARIGLSARGAVYLVVAGLLMWAALSPFKKDLGVDVTDAFLALEQTIAGRICLLLIGGGLAIYALWRWLTAIFNENNPDDEKRIMTRLGMAASGLGYGFLAITAIAVTFGANDAQGPDKTEQLARWLLSFPFGKWLLMIAGGAVAVFGALQFWLVLSAQWRENLVVTGWSKKLRPVAFFGVAGRGVLFIVIAVYLAVGGWQADVDEVKGLAQTLGWLRTQKYGFFLYFGAGLAIGAYGVFSLIQARCYTLAQEDGSNKAR